MIFLSHVFRSVEALTHCIITGIYISMLFLVFYLDDIYLMSFYDPSVIPLYKTIITCCPVSQLRFMFHILYDSLRESIVPRRFSLLSVLNMHAIFATYSLGQMTKMEFEYNYYA